MSDWENEKPINIRTRIALRVLLLMFKILEPYRFEHRFEKELQELSDAIMETPTAKEAKK